MICYFLIFICLVEFVKKHYFMPMMIFWFLLLNGFQIIPMTFLTWGFFSGASIDAALLIVAALFIIRGKFWLKNSIRSTAISKAIIIFMYYVVLNMLYGILVQGYSFPDVLKGVRLYIMLLSFFMFTEIPMSVLIRISKTIVIITFFQSILYLMQIYTGKAILQGGNEYWMSDLDYMRFYNIPFLLNFSICVCLFWFPFRSFLKRYRVLFIFVFSLTVIGPLHRSYIMGWLFMLGIYSIFYNSYLKKGIYLTGTVIIAFILDSIEIIHKRLSDVFQQMSFIGDIFTNKMIEDDNNFSYRINHLIERLIYINTHAFGWLFGIGFIDDRAPQAIKLPLQYGLADPLHGIIQKVYTPDIAWSMLILTMGYVGTILYLNIFVKTIWLYSKDAITPELSKIIFILSLFLLTGMFTSSAITQPNCYIPILMLVVMIEKRKQFVMNMEVEKMTANAA